MSSALNWFVGSALFLVATLVFCSTLGEDIGLNNRNVDVARAYNSSGGLSLTEEMGFFTGLRVTFNEAPVLVSALLLFPSIILLITGYLLAVRGTN